MRLTVEQYNAINRQSSTSKHRNKIVRRHGLMFRSMAQANRWDDLLLCQKSGLIRDLTHEAPFSFDVNGVHICKYYADATYYDCQLNKWTAEDTKGHRTRLYILKRNLFFALYPNWWFKEAEA